MRAKATTEDVRIARVRRSIKRELSRRTRARESLIDFLHFVWWNPWDLIVGRHTRAICDALDQAIADYRRGVSTFLLIAVPFRHGKSDLVSRAFPPYFLATCSDMSPDVILTGYGQDLVEGYSADCHDIIRSKPFEVLFPDTQLERGRANVGSWSVTNSRSRVTAAGMGGALTGKGASLLNVDDYCKNRFEARSETYRNRAWDGFLDALSRRAPVSITLLTATPWHVDDVRGRTLAKMQEDPDFPRFQELRFPARNMDPKTGQWDGSFLFEERFPAIWYREQYSSQGAFAPALLDCDPAVEGGNRFKVDQIVFHDSPADFPNAIRRPDGAFQFPGYRRGWDLASSEKQTEKQNPDWTCGVLGFVREESIRREGLLLRSFEVWVADMVAIRAEAPERDARIVDTVIQDGRRVSQHVEDFGAYKDTSAKLKRLLSGVVSVQGEKLPGDKVVKAEPLEVPMAAGRVHVLRDPKWNPFFVKCFGDFPAGGKDDPVDATAVMFHAFTKDRDGIASPEFYHQIRGR